MFKATNPDSSYSKQYIGTVNRIAVLYDKYRTHVKLTLIHLKNVKGDTQRILERKQNELLNAVGAEKQDILDMISILHKRIEEIETNIVFFETIPIMQYHVQKIINSINLHMTDVIIRKGYKFKVPYLGKISVRRRKRGRPMPNWDLSNKKKQSIIDAGGVPYNKDTAPDGEKWLIYHDGDNETIINWERPPMSFIPNVEFYTFVPSLKGPNSFGTNLHRYVKQNPAVIDRYDWWEAPK
jgi:hypothetical protein